MRIELYPVLKLIIVVCFLLTAQVACAQWTLQISGTTKSLNEIRFPAADTGYVVGDSGTFLRTYNGGALWTPIDLGTTHNLNDLHFINSVRGFVVGDSGFFAQTSDGGETWTRTYMTNVDRVDLSSVHFITPDLGFLGGSEGIVGGVIFKTTDGGQNWSIPNTPNSQQDIRYVRIVFPEPTTGYAITRGMCMKSTDEGANWFVTDSVLVKSGSMFSILEDAFFFSADTGYVVGWYGPFCGYTTNGGESWVDQFVGNNQWRGIDFPSRQVGYMVGWGSMAKTTNGGGSWFDITSPPIKNSGILSIDFTDDVTGYLCGEKGVILKTTSGSATTVEEVVERVVRVYPNPSHRTETVFVDKAGLGCCNAAVINMRGNVVHSELEVCEDYCRIPLGNFTAGVYIVRLVNQSTIVSTVRLVVE